jgi:hypothetical protein
MQEQGLRELAYNHPLSHIIFRSKKLSANVVRGRFDTTYFPEPILAYSISLYASFTGECKALLSTTLTVMECLYQLEQFCSLSAEQQTEYLDSMQAIYELYQEQRNKEIPF